MNFLTETRQCLESQGLNESDIVFIGTNDSESSCTWEEFCVMADYEYDNGFGAQVICDDLTMLFRDGTRMVRLEYDGSEWWWPIRPIDPTKVTRKLEKIKIPENDDE
jgi:hypothetical protein